MRTDAPPATAMRAPSGEKRSAVTGVSASPRPAPTASASAKTQTTGLMSARNDLPHESAAVDELDRTSVACLEGLVGIHAEERVERAREILGRDRRVCGKLSHGA